MCDSSTHEKPNQAAAYQTTAEVTYSLVLNILSCDFSAYQEYFGHLLSCAVPLKTIVKHVIKKKKKKQNKKTPKVAVGSFSSLLAFQ